MHKQQANPQPRVSVVVVFRNPGRHLAETIESVFTQTYGNWELLLCDDGSTDGSAAQAQVYAERYPEKVLCLKHAGCTNRGLSATRSLGVRHATGEWIAWLEAGDVWRPHKLQTQVAHAGQHAHISFTYGPLERWRSWTCRSEDRDADVVEPLAGEVESPISGMDALRHVLQREQDVLQGIMVRRDALKAVGFDGEGVGELGDVIAVARVCLREDGYLSGEALCRYRCDAEIERSPRHVAEAPWTCREAGLEVLLAHLAEAGLASDGVDSLAREAWTCVKPSTLQRAADGLRQRGGAAQHVIGKGLQCTRVAISRAVPAPMLAVASRVVYGRKRTPPVGYIDHGGLRRTAPISTGFGWDRGGPVDRHYVGAFIEKHAHDLRGRAMEVGDDHYLRTYGGSQLQQLDVLHVNHGNPLATLVGDLTTGEGVPRDAFDCMVMTQVFAYIYDFQSAVKHAVGALRPGGVMLVTLPGICQISQYDTSRWGDYWRFTDQSARRLFGEYFSEENLQVTTYGNVLAASSFLYGLGVGELTEAELNTHDPAYQVVVAVHARRPHAEGA